MYIISEFGETGVQCRVDRWGLRYFDCIGGGHVGREVK